MFHPDDSYHGAITAANAKYLIQKGDSGFFTLKSLLDNDLGAPVPTSICKDVLLQDLSFSLEKGDDLYISRTVLTLLKDKRNYFSEVNNFTWYLLSLKEHIFNIVHLLLWHLQEKNINLSTVDKKRFKHYLMGANGVSTAIANFEFLYNTLENKNLADIDPKYKSSRLRKLNYEIRGGNSFLENYEKLSFGTVELLNFRRLIKDPKPLINTGHSISTEVMINKVEKKLKNRLKELISLFLNVFEENGILLVGHEVFYLENCLNQKGVINDFALIKKAIQHDNLFSKMWLL